jgi:hypothetical protein
MTKSYWAAKPNETELTIELSVGGSIGLRGGDQYDSLRGDGLDFVVLDEYASMAREAWTEVLRPALSDRLGKALFIGTPRGFNHFYELFENARGQEQWAAFQYTTAEGGNVTPQELESAAHELDERTYRQEFEASFENLSSGRVYYAFERSQHVRNLSYDPSQPVFWSLDFNLNPLCSVIGQIVGGRIHVLEEMILPNSYTLAACEEFLARTSKWLPQVTFPDSVSIPQFVGGPLSVYVYGDATGAQRQTSASRTDWQIVKEFFGRYPDRFRASFRVPSANPPVKDRVNCVNAMLRNHIGQHRLFVDPKCRQVIQDFEQVSWKTDPYGNPLADLDKSDPMRTHVSDALGYLVVREFPMRPKIGERSGPLLL